MSLLTSIFDKKYLALLIKNQSLKISSLTITIYDKNDFLQSVNKKINKMKDCKISKAYG